MNDTTPNDLSSVPWQTSDQRVRVPDTSMLPGTESTPSAARRLGERVAAAEDAMHVKTDQLRDIRDEWVDGARTTVRSSPLLAVAAALALGAVFARITR
jgi:hypothetical protein